MKEIIKQIEITATFVFSCFVATKIAVFVDIFLAINVSVKVSSNYCVSHQQVLFLMTSWVFLTLSWLVRFWKLVYTFPMELIHVSVISDPVNQIRRYTALSEPDFG